MKGNEGFNYVAFYQRRNFRLIKYYYWTEKIPFAFAYFA